MDPHDSSGVLATTADGTEQQSTDRVSAGHSDASCSEPHQTSVAAQGDADLATAAPASLMAVAASEAPLTATPDEASCVGAEAADLGKLNGKDAPEELALMLKLGLSELSFADLKQLTSELGFAQQVRQQEEKKRLVNDFAQKAMALGMTGTEIFSGLNSKFAHEGLKRGLAKQARRTPTHLDKDGQRPISGASYRHPTSGKVWKKTQTQGGAPKEFIELIHGGRTWQELRVVDAASGLNAGATN